MVDVKFFKMVCFAVPSFLLASLYCAHGSVVVTSVMAEGFDMAGNPLTSTPSNGQEVYNSSGDLVGVWEVVSGNSFTANQDETNSPNATGINYTDSIRIDNVRDTQNSATFASFDAGADSSDFIVIDNESLSISVSWTYRDMRFQRRDMTVAESYDGNWTVTNFNNIDTDLGSQSGLEVVSSMGVGADFGFSGYNDDLSGGSNQIIPAADIVFLGDVPSALLNYSDAAAGELTGKYDGSDFNLTLETSHERDVNATAWLETMNGDGDGTLGENPRLQLRSFVDADYSYDLEFTTFTLVAIPEPTTVSLLGISVLGVFIRRRRWFYG